MKKTAVFVICALSLNWAMAQKTTLTVAAFPAVDDIVKAALQEWQKKNPDVDVKVVGREYADHHTAMTTALATSTGLPDVMTLEYGYLGRFAQSGGLEDLNQAPYSFGQHASKMVAYALAQGRSAQHGQVAIPTDIGPGAMFYRHDLLAKAKVNEAELTQSWDSFIQGGQKIKQSTGAYLVAHARDVKDIVIRSGLRAGEVSDPCLAGFPPRLVLREVRAPLAHHHAGFHPGPRLVRELVQHHAVHAEAEGGVANRMFVSAERVAVEQETGYRHSW